MPRLAQILGLGTGRHRRQDRMRPIVRRNPGRNAFRGLDRQREIGFVLAVGIRDHQRQAQFAAAIARQRKADQAAAIAGHEVDIFRAHTGRRP